MTKAKKDPKGSKWRKSLTQLVDLFVAVLPDQPNVERRQMFGYPCAFVNGNMFTGLHQGSLIVRLIPDPISQNLCAHFRIPMDMMVQG